MKQNKDMRKEPTSKEYWNSQTQMESSKKDKGSGITEILKKNIVKDMIEFEKLILFNKTA